MTLMIQTIVMTRNMIGKISSLRDYTNFPLKVSRSLSSIYCAVTVCSSNMLVAQETKVLMRLVQPR